MIASPRIRTVPVSAVSGSTAPISAVQITYPPDLPVSQRREATLEEADQPGAEMGIPRSFS